jgi:hypothetical protein
MPDDKINQDDRACDKNEFALPAEFCYLKSGVPFQQKRWKFSQCAGSDEGKERGPSHRGRECNQTRGEHRDKPQRKNEREGFAVIGIEEGLCGFVFLKSIAKSFFKA